MAETEELSVPGSVSLADDERDEIAGLKEVVIGDHVKQEILVRAGDSEAIARRLGQRTQASLTYPAEEEDASNIADADVFEIEDELREAREKAEEERVSLLQETMDAHEEATEDGASQNYPSQHAGLDELAAANNITWDDETTVAEKQARLAEEGVTVA